jgi:hypothetical protein
MPILGGFVRLRKHQFGRQADFGTAVPATRAYPFGGTPSVVLNWTDPDVDVGSLDPVAPPYRTAPDLTASLTDSALAYDNIPILMSAFFGGGITPTGSGAGKTWVHDPASLTVDEPDVFTYEFGDDVLTDWFQLRDGLLESLEITGPDGLGPLSTTMTWRFGAVASTGSTDSPVDGTVPTPDLAVSATDALVYLKDGGIWIGDTLAGVFGHQITDALHNFTLRLSHEVDQKRFANGAQTFDLAAYGPGARTIELEATFAKTADIVGVDSESDRWMSDQAVNRYVGLRFISTEVAATPSTFYAWDVVIPMRIYTRTEGEVGQNSTVVLTGHAFYDDVGDTVFKSTAVTTLTEAELGLASVGLMAASAEGETKSKTKTTKKAEAEPAHAAA